MDNQIQAVLLKIIFILSFYNSHLYSPILTYFFPNHFSQRKQQLSKKKKKPLHLVVYLESFFYKEIKLL